jgi:hypothetical protein
MCRRVAHLAFAPLLSVRDVPQGIVEHADKNHLECYEGLTQGNYTAKTSGLVSVALKELSFSNEKIRSGRK